MLDLRTGWFCIYRIENGEVAPFRYDAERRIWHSSTGTQRRNLPVGWAALARLDEMAAQWRATVAAEIDG